MLLIHNAQVEAIELTNLRAKCNIHLDENCALFNSEQRHLKEFQFAEFENNARHQLIHRKLIICGFKTNAQVQCFGIILELELELNAGMY